MAEKVPYIANLTGGTSPDGNDVILEVTTKTGSKLAFALGARELEKMVSFIIGLAQDAAAIRAHPIPESVPTETNPIDVSAIGIGSGRTESEALLAIQVGPLKLSFATEVGTLLDHLELLKTLTKKVDDKRKPN